MFTHQTVASTVYSHAVLVKHCWGGCNLIKLTPNSIAHAQLKVFWYAARFFVERHGFSFLRGSNQKLATEVTEKN